MKQRSSKKVFALSVFCILALLTVNTPVYAAYIGRIEGARLRLTSTKEALYTFNYYPGIIAIPTGVKACISGSALKTEVI